jgi:riboflavin kinase/FMN adenylyltransferase
MIREFISRGEFSKALRLLGHPFQITGRVIKGSGRGRELGFPTANLRVEAQKLIPAHGVYAGSADGKKCVVNIGARPTFGTDRTVVEVHILSYSRNILNKTLKVNLIRRLRDELQFSDVEDLKKQIRKDINRVKRL